MGRKFSRSGASIICAGSEREGARPEMETDRQENKKNGSQHRHSTAAHLLRELKETILRIWEQQARARLQGARKESHLALRDSIPDFLDDLEEALRTSVRNVRFDLVRVAKKHGAERARSSDYTIEEALAEYNLLRKVIFETLEERAPVTSRERDIIYEAINFGITKAGTEYAKLQTEKENLAKLEAQHERTLLEAVINQMPAAVWIADTRGKITGNPFSRTIMRQPAALAGKVGDFEGFIGYHPDGRRYRLEEWPMARSIQKGETIHDEFIRVEGADGGEGYIRVHSTPVHDPDGKITSCVTIGMDVTEMVQTQRRLAESESRLRLALAASKVGIFDYDLKTGFVEWTREEAVMFGFEPECSRLHFEAFNQRVHPEDRARMQEAIEQAVARKGEYRSEFRVILPNGSVRWIRGLGQVTLDGEARPVRVRGANLDFTDVKLAQDERDRESQRLAVITDAQPTLISYIDRNYVYQFVNRTYEVWFGTSRDEVRGKSMEQVLGALAFEELKPFIDRALAGEHVQFEREIHYQKAGIKSIHGTYVPDVSANGEVRGVFVSVSDVTELRRSSERIQQSEEKYRTVTELSPLIKFAADREGRNTYVNRAWLEYMGLENTESGLETWADAVHPEDRESTVRKWKEAVRSKQVYENEYRLRRASDGQYRWFRVKARPVLDSQGNVEQWVGVAVDIHNEIESDREHRRLIDSLQMEKSLREQFVSTLTHDLRTPMAAIKMAAQIALRRTEDPTIQSMTARILENVQRSDKMIEDLLDANRIKAGQGIVPEIREIDLVAVVRATLDDLTTIHGARFVLRAPDELTAYLCPNGMRRVIENLCTNAVKYGRPHQPITVRVESVRDRVRLAVHNEGDPLPEGERVRLFGAYHRTESAVESGAKGWGIGLTIVKGVAQAHCGEVGVKSERGFGTEFFILVPRDARGAHERGCGRPAV
jgi:PAS domain S-box-containing protein